MDQARDIAEEGQGPSDVPDGRISALLLPGHNWEVHPREASQVPFYWSERHCAGGLAAANVVATYFFGILVRAVAVQAVSCSERSDHYFWYFSPLFFLVGPSGRCAGS